MEITPEILKDSFGEAEAQAVYQVVKQEDDLVGFARQFMNHEDYRVARSALWALTKGTDQELSALQGMREELIDLAMTTDNSSVRRLSLNLIERLKMNEEDLRADFLDFCFEHMMDVEEFPGIQSICMKLAFRICQFYPDLMDELKRTLVAMQIEYYKPAVKSIRDRILKGKFK
ncbi:MAG: hypothetical protein IKU00_07875 [Bacteroidales bacterium]|nr:hypothetical protein [Bacteroidales bacterium]